MSRTLRVGNAVFGKSASLIDFLLELEAEPVPDAFCVGDVDPPPRNRAERRARRRRKEWLR